MMPCGVSRVSESLRRQSGSLPGTLTNPVELVALSQSEEDFNVGGSVVPKLQGLTPVARIMCPMES